MKTIANRRKNVIGRFCAVCGFGQSQSKGGLMGATSNLLAAGYSVPRNVDAQGVDRGSAMLFAHLSCLEKIHGSNKAAA